MLKHLMDALSSANQKTAHSSSFQCSEGVSQMAFKDDCPRACNRNGDSDQSISGILARLKATAVMVDLSEESSMRKKTQSYNFVQPKQRVKFSRHHHSSVSST